MASDQVSQWRRDRNVQIPAAEAAFPLGLSDRSFRVGITGRQNPLVVGTAVSLGLVNPRAVGHRAEPARSSERLLADISIP
jgi:hypothetical protein